MPNPEQATHFLDGVSNFVPDMQYHSDVGTDGTTKQYTKTAPVAASATGILSAQSVAAIGSVQAAGLVAGFDKTKMGDWGRAVSIVASGAGTGTVVVKGRDYLGAPMREDLALAGATPVNGKKAFKYIDSISWPAVGAVTMNVGYLDIFGIPFCADALLQERVNDAVTGTAGTFVAAVKTDPATATTGDTRGTYAPAGANAANGSRTYQLVFGCDKNKLHGVKQYFA
jgi:hypothetical protein